MMNLFIFLVTIFITTNSYSWTLNPSTAQGFNNNSIDIHVANTDCSGAGFTTAKYTTLIRTAVKRFWNKVPTTSLYLNVKGINTTIDINGDDHTAALLKVPKNSILAGCNDDADDFDDAGILGSAQMSCTGGNCTAVLILNAHANSGLPGKSDEDLESIIAHEIGHAFGLGHSEFKHSLMYFSISGKYQRWLGMDDIDGVNYLYPTESELDILGLSVLGNCGAVASVPGAKKPTISSFLVSIFFGMLFIILIYGIKNLFTAKR
jgi:hypothetical protein